jgi:hydroxyquinol 1,2-dioxygenase
MHRPAVRAGAHQETGGMRNLDEQSITQAVLQRHAQAPDARLRDIMDALVRHLHDFAREVALTEAEWLAGIRFLTQCGDITDPRRQEFILLSDTLGLSMLVTALNHRKPPGCTEATVFGPFHVAGAPRFELGADLACGARGEPCFVRGRVLGAGGEPVPGAELEVWQADEAGFYDVQYGADAPMQARGVLRADEAGRFHFRTIVANAYPIPHDGPVGAMLKALGRHPWRPAHLHFMVSAPGCERLITHVFREGDPYLESDAVFGVRSSLVTQWVRHEPSHGHTTAPDGTVMQVPFYTLDFDFVLHPAKEA